MGKENGWQFDKGDILSKMVKKYTPKLHPGSTQACGTHTMATFQMAQ